MVGSETGEAQAVNNDLEPGDTFEVEKTFSEASSNDYDALIVPGAASARTNSAPTTMQWR